MNPLKNNNIKYPRFVLDRFFFVEQYAREKQIKTNMKTKAIHV